MINEQILLVNNIRNVRMRTHVKVQKVKAQDPTVQWTIVAYRDFFHRYIARLFLATEGNNRLSY